MSNSEKYTDKEKKLHQKYLSEQILLVSMFRCAIRYLSSKERVDSISEQQQMSDEKMIEDFKHLYQKYSKRLDKKCFKRTGLRLSDIDKTK